MQIVQIKFNYKSFGSTVITESETFYGEAFSSLNYFEFSLKNLAVK